MFLFPNFFSSGIAPQKPPISPCFGLYRETQYIEKVHFPYKNIYICIMVKESHSGTPRIPQKLLSEE